MEVGAVERGDIFFLHCAANKDVVVLHVPSLYTFVFSTRITCVTDEIVPSVVFHVLSLISRPSRWGLMIFCSSPHPPLPTNGALRLVLLRERIMAMAIRNLPVRTTDTEGEMVTTEEPGARRRPTASMITGEHMRKTIFVRHGEEGTAVLL